MVSLIINLIKQERSYTIRECSNNKCENAVKRIGTKVTELDELYGLLCDECNEAVLSTDKKVVISICFNCNTITNIYYMDEEQESKICYCPTCEHCDKLKGGKNQTNLFTKPNLN